MDARLFAQQRPHFLFWNYVANTLSIRAQDALRFFLAERVGGRQWFLQAFFIRWSWLLKIRLSFRCFLGIGAFRNSGISRFILFDFKCAFSASGSFSFDFYGVTGLVVIGFVGEPTRLPCVFYTLSFSGRFWIWRFVDRFIDGLVNLNLLEHPVDVDIGGFRPIVKLIFIFYLNF